MDMVNVSGESRNNGDQCMTEKIKSSPRTITIPPLKTCTTGTISDPLSVTFSLEPLVPPSFP